MITRAYITERKTAATPADRERMIQLPQAQQFSPGRLLPRGLPHHLGRGAARVSHCPHATGASITRGEGLATRG
jgi:hypothetical protein